MIRKNKTTKELKVDLIITADWHLMEKERNPPCRLDSHWNTQWDKINQIKQLQIKHKCPIYVAGDVFEHWKTSPQLLNMCIDVFSLSDIYSVIGNHDMPQHNFELMEKSGLETLFATNIIKHLKRQIDWGCPIDYDEIKIKKHKVILSHMMVWKGKRPWPGCTDPEADDVFDIFPNANLIITGHNHKTFTVRKGKQLLINPGSLTRHKADQANHKPCVFLWNAETNKYKIHYLKIKKNVISREHIDIKKNKEERGLAFIEKLKSGWDISLSFKDNLEIAFQENKISEKIKQLIYKWYGV